MFSSFRFGRKQETSSVDVIASTIIIIIIIIISAH